MQTYVSILAQAQFVVMGRVRVEGCVEHMLMQVCCCCVDMVASTPLPHVRGYPRRDLKQRVSIG